MDEHAENWLEVESDALRQVIADAISGRVDEQLVKDAIREELEDSVLSFIGRLRTEQLEAARVRARETVSARKHVRSSWGEPLDRLIMLCVAAHSFLKESREAIDPLLWKSDLVLRVVMTLYGRIVRTAIETLTLLEQGYPDGALARWRSVYEMTVVAAFISKDDANCAQAYVDHGLVQEKKLLSSCMVHAGDLQWSPSMLKEIQDSQAGIAERIKQAEVRYAKVRYKRFSGEYGWAWLTKDPKQFTSDPTLKRLAELVGLDYLHPYYLLANNATHATTRGLAQQLSASDPRGRVVVGPRKTGLAVPGQCLARSLAFAVSTAADRISAVLETDVSLHTVAAYRETVARWSVHVMEAFDAVELTMSGKDTL